MARRVVCWPLAIAVILVSVAAVDDVDERAVRDIGNVSVAGDAEEYQGGIMIEPDDWFSSLNFDGDVPYEMDGTTRTRVKRHDSFMRREKKDLHYEPMRVTSWMSDNFKDRYPHQYPSKSRATLKRIIDEVTAEIVDGFKAVRMPYSDEEDSLYVDFAHVRHNFNGNYETAAAAGSKPAPGNRGRLIPKTDLLILWKASDQSQPPETQCRQISCDTNQQCRVIPSSGFLATAGPAHFTRILDKDDRILYARVTVIGVQLCPELGFTAIAKATCRHEVFHGLGSLGNSRPESRITLNGYYKRSGEPRDDWLSGSTNANWKPDRIFETLGHLNNTRKAMAEYYKCDEEIMKDEKVLGLEWVAPQGAHPLYRTNFADYNKASVSIKYFQNLYSPITLAYLADRRFYNQFPRGMSVQQIANWAPPMFQLAENSTMLRESAARYWFAKGAGCAFLTDGCYEYVLKRYKHFLGKRHAPGYPYCTPYEVLKTKFAERLPQNMPSRGAIPMCSNKNTTLVTGYMKCELQNGPGDSNFWYQKAQYSKSIEKWLNENAFDWIGGAGTPDEYSWRQHYMRSQPTEPGRTEGCVVWSPSTSDGRELTEFWSPNGGERDWPLIEALADSMPCRCNVETGIACDPDYDLADPPIHDQFWTPPDWSEINQRNSEDGSPMYEYYDDDGAACITSTVFCVIASVIFNFVIL